MAERLYIFDTTLRDGEQAPGYSMNLEEKIRIAKQLEALGVDIIEAGFAISSPGDAESVEAIARSVSDVTVASLARCVRKERAYHRSSQSIRILQGTVRRLRWHMLRQSELERQESS